MIMEQLLPRGNYRVFNLARHGQSWHYPLAKLSRSFPYADQHVHVIDYSLHNHRLWLENQKGPRKSRVDIDAQLGEPRGAATDASAPRCPLRSPPPEPPNFDPDPDPDPDPNRDPHPRSPDLNLELLVRKFLVQSARPAVILLDEPVSDYWAKWDVDSTRDQARVERLMYASTRRYRREAKLAAHYGQRVSALSVNAYAAQLSTREQALILSNCTALRDAYVRDKVGTSLQYYVNFLLNIVKPMRKPPYPPGK